MTTTITPFSDPALEELAKVIFEKLNNREVQSVGSWRVLSGADPTRAIGSLLTAKDFPALILKQRSAEGEDFTKCQGEIIYLISVASGRGRSLTWVQRAIAVALREYVDFQDWPLCAVNYSEMRAEQDTITVANDVLMKTSIRFQYQDRATL